MITLFDLPERYVAQFVPDAFPDQPQPRLQNWSEEDIEMYCGTRKEIA